MKPRKPDFWTVINFLALVAFGFAAVYKATSGTNLDGLHKSDMSLFAVFCIPMMVTAFIDYRIWIGKLAYVLYAMSIGLLLLVKFIGEDINGAVRWLNVGSLQLQPSELAKLFTIMLAASWLQRRKGQSLRLVKDLLPLFIIFIIPTYLIMSQPDLGTALVFVGIFFTLMWIANTRLPHVLGLLGSIACIVATIVQLYYHNHELLAKIIKPHQMARIQTFLDPNSDPNKSYHVAHAQIAIGIGGLKGDGGQYVQQGFVPYAYSDSIFTVVSENFGFIGNALLIALFFMLIYRITLIMLESRDVGGTYLVAGIAGMILFQIFVNIGMHIGFLPLTGISLPFISYGGSSLLTNMIAIGLVLSVKMHNEDEAGATSTFSV
ncbi:rod shape-determining protein RodA [Paenibacillus lycopersici]|uniref:Rod shape-determining protein RodA n=1 Tax=Paenibacillus lycopersici TaxID=2704462 RepID=A0A6C0G2Y2_9BACL|nr:FtsW/RodA/SpoVE family cell cycle protein [Paenibacillus lycopersici]QHT62323.1 rod shape-determining protein RodA [Paenibacillus lycopersici]